MKDLIAKLEAAKVGDTDLDMEIFWAVFPAYDRGKDPIWHCLPYSTSLDAALPGENILLVEFQADGWHAWHFGPSDTEEDFVGIAHTEALARRIAALRGGES